MLILFLFILTSNCHVMELNLEVVFMEKKPNRLIKEKSPYLLQHAYNPIYWYACSDEAFEKAKREDKPILISIGYSACHWCHVIIDTKITTVLGVIFLYRWVFDICRINMGVCSI
jgi:hypothetical protein